ncbi:type II toxin-antitoxin system RelE/ParE family toxin [Roseimaritima sediminicola]|uniref:type II toxin-antitoxin system RelE/ParE family toxin n=1 Tax=Roseimaritima sediminicola TaxID=2662066 RepID=UPI0012983C97|nr:type II toxin-antitoxin system RelE/ParE family toxin [Roseimaritima sediminicola]
MANWDIEYTDEFEVWWNSLDANEQDAIDRSVRLLASRGPQLSRPHADTVQGSKFDNMKELRTQHHGRPYRTFFAFDPRRTAILLIGGDKTGDDRFYDRLIPLADALFETYLGELKQEGEI